MIPLAELKEHLRVPHSDDDSYIVALEEAAVEYSSTLEGAWYGTPGSNTVWMAGSGSKVLLLDDATAVVTDVAGVTGWEQRGQRLLLDAGWARGTDYPVTYDRGYPNGAPARVRQAVLSLVAHWYANRTPVAFTSTSEVPYALPLFPRPVVA